MKRYARIRHCACLVAYLFFLMPSGVDARTDFEGLDLGAENRLLFKATAGGDGSPRQSALFVADVVSGLLTQLTAFPERVELVDGGRSLQIRNPFGAARISLSGGLPKPVRGFPSFASGALVLAGRPEDLAASPDGKWILYVEPTTAAFGRLVLIDAAKGTRVPVASDIERPGKTFPASWSPDSRVFVYERDRKLYSGSVDASTGSVVDERFRLVGEGAIASIRWGSAGDFFYLRGSTVYRVRGSDLFARSLYADFLEVGMVAGKIPFDFDPNFDSFWTAPDGSAVLVAKGGRNFFYYPLGVDDYGEEGAASLPYLMLPRSCSRLNVLWSSSGIVTIFAAFPEGSDRSTLAYRLRSPTDEPSLGNWGFVPIEAPKEAQAVLSPDGTRSIVYGPEGAVLYDYVNWRTLARIGSVPTVNVLWLGNEEVIVADALAVRRRALDGKETMICLSSVEQFGFDETGTAYLARSGGSWYQTDGIEGWKPSKLAGPRPVSTSSSAHRVYLERLSSGPYESMPMIRDIRGVGTRSLFVKPPAYPQPEISTSSSAKGSMLDSDPIDLRLEVPFTHGARAGRKEISIVFDLMEDAEGLPFVLDTLKRFDVSATFFLNGEFIRRHPSAAKEIADAGHETASLFFAPIDLADSRYRIDADFIRRGLARNEDEFFNATGSELSLLWHAPYYAVSSTIVSAGASAGYRYIGRELDPLDWFTRVDARRNPALYKSAAQIVDALMDAKRPGAIIPIRVGVPSGGRDDYLFGKIDVLLDALMREGFQSVPVSVLVDHAR